MCRVRSALAVAVLTTACLWAQQGETPDSHDATTEKASPDSTPALSDADKSLACPASLTPHGLPDGVYRVGGGVKPPEPLKQMEAEFSDEARKMFKKNHLKSFQASSLVRLIVDKDGNPQDICVQRAAGYSLDGQAVKAVRQYRFRPATKPDGAPVPVVIAVEMNFRLSR